MNRKQLRQQSALRRRQRDVESYTKALHEGNWEHLFEDLDEKGMKAKLTKARHDIENLETKLSNVLTTSEERSN